MIISLTRSHYSRKINPFAPRDRAAHNVQAIRIINFFSRLVERFPILMFNAIV